MNRTRVELAGGIVVTVLDGRVYVTRPKTKPPHERVVLEESRWRVVELDTVKAENDSDVVARA